MKRKIVACLIITGCCYLPVHSQPQQQPSKPPSIEERMKRVETELNKGIQLSAEQKKKVEAAYKTFFTKMDKLRGNMPPPPPPPPKDGAKMPPKEEVDKLVNERDNLIQSSLNSEQFKKYKEIEKTLRPPPPPPPPNKQ